MKDKKIMLTMTWNALDSPLGESEVLNLKIISSESVFSLESIVESVTTLLNGHKGLCENGDIFCNSAFNEGGAL